MESYGERDVSFMATHATKFAPSVTALHNHYQAIVLHYNQIVFMRLFIVAKVQSLDLETTRTTATTSPFELASLGADERLHSSVRVRVVDRSTVAKVSKGFT